jgi:hypothetical protein
LLGVDADRRSTKDCARRKIRDRWNRRSTCLGGHGNTKPTSFQQSAEHQDVISANDGRRLGRHSLSPETDLSFAKIRQMLGNNPVVPLHYQSRISFSLFFRKVSSTAYPVEPSNLS